jgi:acyl dehydratase
MKQSTWSVRAKNLPEHSRNPIHTDEGGKAAGFDGALVAGVTVYAYLTNPILTLWGIDWLRQGVSLVEFKSPVLANELVECVTVLDEKSLNVNATVNDQIRAQCTASMKKPILSTSLHSKGESLKSENIHLVDEWESYGQRCGDDHEIYSELGVIHPSVWPALANHVVEKNLVNGAWIHTRSKIFHHGLVKIGSLATIESCVINRFKTKTGDRAVIDVSITVDGEKVVDIEHESIISLNKSS